MDWLKTQDDGERGRGGLHMEQLNTFKTLKDPAHGWACAGFVHLVRNGLLCLDQTCPQPIFGQAVDQQAQDHNQTQDDDPLRFRDCDREGEKKRIFQKTKAALDPSFVVEHYLSISFGYSS